MIKTRRKILNLNWFYATRCSKSDKKRSYANQLKMHSQSLALSIFTKDHIRLFQRLRQTRAHNKANSNAWQEATSVNRTGIILQRSKELLTMIQCIMPRHRLHSYLLWVVRNISILLLLNIKNLWLSMAESKWQMLKWQILILSSSKFLIPKHHRLFI